MKKNFLKPGTNPWYGIVTFWQPVSKDYCRQIITLLLLHRVPINNCCSYTCFPNFCFIHCFSVAHLFFYNWLINHFEKVRYCIIWIHWNENYNWNENLILREESSSVFFFFFSIEWILWLHYFYVAQKLSRKESFYMYNV